MKMVGRRLPAASVVRHHDRMSRVIPKSKESWRGIVLAVQPRIRLTRSFDERSHEYLGFLVRIEGEVNAQVRTFAVALGKVVYAKHGIVVGDELAGEGVAVPNPPTDVADYYRVSKLKVVNRSSPSGGSPPPWHEVGPDLPTYRERGHRRLDKQTYDARCSTCVWGCLMPTEIIIDKWAPGGTTHRLETFCYGPRSCPLYRPGPKRQVRGRKGQVHVEQDLVDEDDVAHRALDE